MTAKEYLLEIQKYHFMVLNKENQLRRIRESVSQLLSIQGIRYDRDRVQTSPQDPMSGNVAELIDAERELEKCIMEYNAVINRRVDQINSMDKTEHVIILSKRYLSDKTTNFQTIADDMGYSYDRACHIHGEALREFEKKFPEILRR